MPEPFAIVSVEEMRALEQAAVEAGTPEHVLQERAGLAVADAVAARLRPGERARIVALVGAGNNGRDAVVAGRRLGALGHTVALWFGPRHALTDQELRDLAAEGIACQTADAEAGFRALSAALAGCRVVLDGLLGVGSHGPMRPGVAEIATTLSAARAACPDLLVVAVDVPSGIDADTGAVPGAAVRADVTVTFGAVKAGLLRFPAASLVGELEPRPIGLPSGANGHYRVHVLDEAVAASLVPDRPIDAHKYRLGRTLVVAGSDQFIGAACLTASAAARAGCGLVAVAASRVVQRVLAGMLPEATYPLIRDTDGDPEPMADRLADLLPAHQSLVVGPGLGRADTTGRFLQRLLTRNMAAQRPVPCAIDADALNLLTGWEHWWREIGPGHVLTPHAGEMAALLGVDRLPDDAAPWDVAREAASVWRQVVVLKGPFTTVATPFGGAWVYPHANPALATAGTGDVLAGLLGGLIAQQMAPDDAARLAVVVHAIAARRVLARRGGRTLLASDLLPEIPAALSDLAGSSPSV
ncbi:MAG: NAD(P)H-hydrate dehydratase [Chloroflexi bacterium]|nr:NAD(P)H-hydrate dehydratase [Chloroflexota bacterium]